MAAASNKSRFVIERLEDRIAPSSMNFCCDDGSDRGSSHKHSSKKCKSSKKSHKHSSKKCKGSSKKSHKGSSKKCKSSKKSHKGSSKKCKGSSKKVVKCGKKC